MAATDPLVATLVPAAADGFGDTAWFAAWLEAFAPGAPRYRVAVDGARLTPELIPANVDVLRRPLRMLRAPVNDHTPRYGWKLGAVPPVLPLAAALRDALKRSGCHGMEIRLLPAGASTFEVLRALARHDGWVIAVEDDDPNPVVDTTGDWTIYRRARPAKMKKANWQENKLRQLGHLECRDVGRDPDWPTWLDRALELEAAGWKGRGGTAILHRRNEGEFYRAVTRSAAADDRLRLWVAVLDGRLIAFLLMLEDAGIWYALKTAYEEKHATYSPGTVLLRAALKEAFADGAVRGVDLPGPGQWKLQWATRSDQLKRIRMAPAASLAGALLYAEILARRARSRLWNGRAGTGQQVGS